MEYYHHHHQQPPPSSSYYPPPSSSSYYPPPPPIPGAPYPPPPPHHQTPPPPIPLPYYVSPYPPSTLPEQPSSDEAQVRTLFIAGLPDDVRQREIYNLFREFPGYKSSKLRSSGESNTRAYAFAVFADQHSAVTAMHALNGLKFDLEKESILYVSLAKSNSRSKRQRTDDASPYSPDKKLRGPVELSRGFLDSGVGSHIHMPGMGNSAYSMNGYPSTQSHTILDYGTTDSNKLSNNTPCPTLFVATLGPTCSEQELTQAFSRCPGFLKLKMQNKNGVPVAFVDFQDVASSTAALHHMQGVHLYSSVGEGMRLEYAKSRMGQRKREKKT